MRNKLLNGFLILGSLVLFACGGGGGGSTTPSGQNPGGGNNPGGGGPSPGGAPTSSWIAASGIGMRSSALNSIFCSSANACLASGAPFTNTNTGSYEILKSADQGHSWAVTYQDNSGSIGFVTSEVYMADPLNGITFMGLHPLLKTSDGGNTWTASTANIFAATYAFVDSKRGVSTALTVDGIEYTTDGGNTWTASAVTIGGISTNPVNYMMSKPVFIPSGSGFLPTGYAVIGKSDPYLNYTSYLLKTTDGGKTWTDVPTGNGNQFFQVVTFTDPNHGWIGTIQGNVIATSDGGNTWASHSVGISNIPNISCVGASNCWVLAGNTIRASTDGGTTWAAQTPPAGGLVTYYTDIHFLDSHNGILVGSRIPSLGAAAADFSAYTTTGGF